jgi:cell division transport system ATP-binding protein
MSENHSVVLLHNATIQNHNQIVAHNTNVNINKGEFVYLIGKTGSGKSSLLKTIYGAIPLTVGEGIVVGYDMKKINRKQIPHLRRRLGIVFQDFRLLEDRNIEANMHFVLKATGWNDSHKMLFRINEVLNMVGLSGLNHKMPNTLSGGEQQRVVIARALLNNPELIIADEPTGNLDPETSLDIVKILMELSKNNNTAVLLATHDYRIIDHYPARIIRCQNGQFLEV